MQNNLQCKLGIEQTCAVTRALGDISMEHSRPDEPNEHLSQTKALSTMPMHLSSTHPFIRTTCDINEVGKHILKIN